VTGDIITKMNLNCERDPLQFAECFVVLPEALDRDEQSIEQLAPRRQFGIVTLSCRALADEASRVACVGQGSFRPTKGGQRGIGDFELSLPDQLPMPNIETDNGNTDCGER
jgi:hypothetical protein